MLFEKSGVCIGIATYEIYIYSIERSQFTEKETGKVRWINRVSSNIGVIMVNDDVAERLLKAEESFVAALQGKGKPDPALLSATNYVKDGSYRWQISV